MPTGNLPAEGKKLWEEVYDKAKSGSCKDSKDPEACAAGSAWKAVKNAGWTKNAEGQWTKKAEYIEEALVIKKAYVDQSTGERRWRADTSNTSDDKAGDNMTLELFADFQHRIENDELAPEQYRSEFWNGGMPYLSVSHYPDLEGKAVPGSVDAVYVDGKYLKAKGRMSDSALGEACWKSICNDLERIKKGETVEDKVRVSIGFLDYAHKHKSNGYVFERKSLDDICPECLREIMLGEYSGRSFLKGLLVHLAMTRVPMNPDTTIDPDLEVTRSMTTRKEDAASIIGDDLADELDKEAKLVGKSEALIVKAEETCPDCGSKMVDGKCPKCDEEDDEKEEKAELVQEADVVSETPALPYTVDLTPIIAELHELRSMVTAPVQEKHVLDEALGTFKSSYDEIVKMEETPDNKLRMLQASYETLGGTIIATIKSVQSEPEVVNNSASSADIVKAFVDALAPLTQKLDLLLAQQKPVQVQSVPQRRSFTPEMVQQSQAETPKVNPFTGKPLDQIDQIARRSVGLKQ